MRTYSIFLDPETRDLFGYVEVADEARWQAIATTPVCRRWWTAMRELMPSNADDSPVSRELREVFHIARRAGLSRDRNAACTSPSISARAAAARFSARSMPSMSGCDEVHRFHYAPRQPAGPSALGHGARCSTASARACAAPTPAAGPQAPTSVGVDTWGVDYGLVDADGRLLEEPCSYRDARTDGVMEEVFARVPRADIFDTTGLQFLPFNTLYQLVAHLRDGLPPRRARLLMMPDLCHHWLCGSMVGEETNASTTQLLDARTRGWATSCVNALGLPAHLLPELVPAGTDARRLLPERQTALGVGAAARRRARDARHRQRRRRHAAATTGWAFISSGTWSLVGVERDAPLSTRASPPPTSPTKRACAARSAS